jgi:hypothetical protein
MVSGRLKELQRRPSFHVPLAPADRKLQKHFYIMLLVDSGEESRGRSRQLGRLSIGLQGKK